MTALAKAIQRTERLRSWRNIVRLQHRNGWLTDAGQCMTRVGSGRKFATYHPEAPAETVSHCRICGRVVMRGEGRWWE